MKFYRVHFVNHAEMGSQGYEFFTSKRAAEKKAREYGPTAEVEEIQVTPTRAGILDALNRYGSHPDNG